MSIFTQLNFAGDFHIRNWFKMGVMPRAYMVQANSKLLFTHKVLHHNNECCLIRNSFTFPEQSRYVISPEGVLLLTGGYMPVFKSYVKNTFIYDDFSQLFVPKGRMNHSRADHALVYSRNRLFVLGGISDPAGQPEALNSVEVYSIPEDKWVVEAPMPTKRYAAGVCSFNDKHIFLFGGK